MEKRIIRDAEGNVYNFDGKKMEPIGKSEDLKVYGDGVEAVGDDLYYKNNEGEYSLLAKDSQRVEFCDAEIKPQFYLSQKGILFFKQDADSIPVRLPKMYAKHLPGLLQAPQKLNETAFVALSTTGNRSQVFLKKAKGAPELYPQVSEAYVTRDGADTCMAWNGMGFILMSNGWMRLNATLLYEGHTYILFSCGSFCFSIYLDKPEIDVFAKPVKVEDTVEADILITKDKGGQQLYHLTEEGIKHIATALGDIEISSDGTIKDTYARKVLSGLPMETKTQIYTLENGEYVVKK